MEDFGCIDFDDKACQDKDRQDKNGQSMRAADSVCIQISGCDKGFLYIIETLNGILDVKDADDKADQIESTIDILKKNPLFEDYLQKRNGKVRKIIVCEKYGQGAREKINKLKSRDFQVYSESKLSDSDDDERIAKFVYYEKKRVKH